MTNRALFLQLAICLLFLSVNVWAIDYYVDATGGNDSNAGTSTGAAWKTLSKVAGQSFSAGDNIHFKRGEQWNENAQITITYSGSSGNPITFKDYGAGALPILSGALAMSEQTWEWQLSPSEANTYYIRITGGGDPGISDPSECAYCGPMTIFLESDYTEINVGSFPLNNGEFAYGDQDTLGYNTIYVRYNDTTPPNVYVPQATNIFKFSGGREYVDFENLVIEGATIQGVLSKTEPGTDNLNFTNVTARYNGGTGISVAGFGTEPIALDVTVVNCTTYNNGFDGVGITGAGAECPNVAQKATGIFVDNLTSYNNYQDGIKIFYSIGSEMKNSNVYNNTNKGINFDGQESCDVVNDPGVGNDDCEIHHNIVQNNGTQGILSEYYADNCKIHHNLITGNCSNCGGGMGSLGIVYSATNHAVYYNIVDSDYGAYIFYATQSETNFPSENHTIVHNTFVRGAGYGMVFVETKDSTVKNNIILDVPVDDLYVVANSGGTEDFDYNIYDPVPLDRFRWESNFWSFAQYQANSGHGANSISQADLEFVDTSTFNYTPVTGNPAIMAGATGLPAYIYEDGDYFGNPVDTAAPTIGALEPETVKPTHIGVLLLIQE